MSNARPNNLPTRPQTPEVQRDQARRDKNKFTQRNCLTIRFGKGRVEIEQTKTEY